MNVVQGSVRRIAMVEQPADNIYRLVTGLATQSSNRKLSTVLGATLIIGAGALLLSPALWPVAAFAGSIGAIATWGLLAHRVASNPSSVLALVQVVLVAIGVGLAIVAAIRIWYAMLGPRWML